MEFHSARRVELLFEIWTFEIWVAKLGQLSCIVGLFVLVPAAVTVELKKSPDV